MSSVNTQTHSYLLRIGDIEWAISAQTRFTLLGVAFSFNHRPEVYWPEPDQKLARLECRTEIGGDVIPDPLTCACWQGENTLAFHTATLSSQGTPHGYYRREFALSPGRIRVLTAGGVVADEKTCQQKPMQPTHVVGPLYSRS